jgi:hypothetical protein
VTAVWAPRELQQGYTHHPEKVALFIGDSFTNSRGIDGILTSEEFGGVVEELLNVAGCHVRHVNCGLSGDTTTGMLNRMAASVLQAEKNGAKDGVADLVCIFGGYNDPGNAILASTTTLNIQQMIKYVRCKCTGVAGVPGTLPADAPVGARYVVTNDNSTSGGRDLIVPGQPGQFAKVPGVSATSPRVWQNRNGSAGEAGWGRIADPNDGTPFVVVGTGPFQNFTPGGDVAATLTQNATQAAVRTAQTQAVTNEGGAPVYLHDMWLSQAQLISPGTVESQNSNTWGFTGLASPNPHPGKHGAQAWGILWAKFLLAINGLQAALTVSP